MATGIVGRALTLTFTWYEFAGGPPINVTGQTVEIVRLSDGAVMVAETSVGIEQVSTGLYRFVWDIPDDAVVGDYVAIWRVTGPSTDEGSEQIYVYPTSGAGRAYTTPQGVKDYAGSGVTYPDDDELWRMIHRATSVIDRNAGGWDVDVDLLPTSMDVAQTLNDATAAQVEMWLGMGEGVDIETWPTTTQTYQSGDTTVAGPPSRLAYRARRELMIGGLWGAEAV